MISTAYRIAQGPSSWELWTGRQRLARVSADRERPYFALAAAILEDFDAELDAAGEMLDTFVRTYFDRLLRPGTFSEWELREWVGRFGR